MVPIIKWAGSKRQLLPELNKHIPNNIGKYVEPFLGSGALFFDLEPHNAILNDFNPELINLYINLRDNLDELSLELYNIQTEYNNLNTMDRKSALYYKLREDYNDNLLLNTRNAHTAAIFIFLNKACYNGLYRVNKSGLYNTPWGKRDSISLYEPNNFAACSKSLANAKILCGDFEAACKGLHQGDFVYFDSPYFDTFDTYQAGGFPVEEHIRLSKLYNKLSNKGVLCLLSNSDTNFIKDLYKEYRIDIVPVKRMINRNGRQRSGTEVIIRNY